MSKSPSPIPRKTIERIDKLYNDAAVRKGKVEKIAHKASIHDAQEATFKPSIDKNSRKITSLKKTAPIHERYQEVLLEKQKAVKRIRQKALEEEIEKHPENYNYAFRPLLEVSQMGVSKERRDFEEFLRDVNAWHDKKRRNILQRTEERNLQEHIINSHQPKISSNTDKLLETKKSRQQSFLERESSFLERVNMARKEKIEQEIDNLFFPITENRIKELRSHSAIDGNNFVIVFDIKN